MISRATVRTILWHIATASAGFALAYALVAAVLLPAAAPGSDVSVPALGGLTYAQAIERLREVGLRATLGRTRTVETAAPGTVLSQAPAAETFVRKGTAVILDLSADRPQTTVPPVAGFGVEEARRVLMAAGLVPGETVTETSEQPAGAVVGTRPATGQILARGTTVELVISDGPADTIMPDLMGRDGDDARGLLTQLGIANVTVRVDSASLATPNSVVEQSPPAGTPLTADTFVFLRLARSR